VGGAAAPSPRGGERAGSAEGDAITSPRSRPKVAGHSCQIAPSPISLAFRTARLEALRQPNSLFTIVSDSSCRWHPSCLVTGHERETLPPRVPLQPDFRLARDFHFGVFPSTDIPALLEAGGHLFTDKAFGGGSYSVTVSQNADGTYLLSSTGTYKNAPRKINAVVSLDSLPPPACSGGSLR